MNCWASCLGNCDNKITREHYISDGIFENTIIRVKGLSWCKGEEKEIGLQNAVSKILCKKHNNDLSNFDCEASKLSKFLRESIRGNSLECKKILINGKYLEKWALKTFINLGILGALDQENFTKIVPVKNLVRYIYCDDEIDHGVGIYFIGCKIYSEWLGDSVTWKALKNESDNNQIIGMQFSINGLCFIFNTNPVGTDEEIKIVSSRGIIDEFEYRPTQISLCSKSTDINVIQFNWQ